MSQPTPPSLRARKPTTTTAPSPTPDPPRDDDDAATPLPNLPVREPTWLDPGTWSPSTRFLPAYLALLAIFISLYVFRDLDDDPSSCTSCAADGGHPSAAAMVLERSSHAACAATFHFAFPINDALTAMRAGAGKGEGREGTEIGYAGLAAMEVFDFDLDVYPSSSEVFPGGKVRGLGWGKLRPSLLYVDQRVRFYDRKMSVGSQEVWGLEAAALGVPGLILSGRRAGALAALQRLGEWLVTGEGPRFVNGAIALERLEASVWVESVATFPPFLAYLGVKTGEVDLAREAVRQVGLHRDLLVIRSGRTKGLWRHIAGPEGTADEGAWATGNALAAWGMTRTRATISAWAASNTTMEKEIRDLDLWIQEILDAAIKTDDDGSDLLRNYLGDSAWSGELSGTSLLAAVAYRMVVIDPGRFANDKYLQWAGRKRRSVFSRIDKDGIAKSAIDPASYKSKRHHNFSPQAQAFVVLLGTAWRDCVCAGICLDEYYQEHPQPVPKIQTMPWDNMYAYFSNQYAQLRARLAGKLKYFRGPGQ